QLVGGETQRSCVECRILMTPARLPSGASVEVCSACRGMFLDAGELAPLGVRETPPPAIRPPPPPVRVPPPPPRRAEPAHTPRQPHSVEDHREHPLLIVAEEEPVVQPAPGTFLCVECGQARPLREGQALRDGLACRACMKARTEG
ncbi:MAG TPA: zf-TFIIB domain-containing protein, partial [Cystobacter sp.]